MKDLINDEVEEEGEDSENEDIRGIKRSHQDEEFEEDLEDDDYDLIEENLGRKIKRKKKFRRVRRLEDDEEEEKSPQNDRDTIAQELFETDENEEQHREPTPNEPTINKSDIQYYSGNSDSEGEEEDNFIVDDNDQPIANRQSSSKGLSFAQRALQQAKEVFGTDYNFEDIEAFDGKDADESDDDFEEKFDENGEFIEKKKKRSTRKTIYELYEPAELKRSYLMARDTEIRNKDLPERFQLRNIEVTKATDAEIIEEAEWIYHEVFEALTITKIDEESSRKPLGGSKPKSVLMNIREVLQFIRNDSLEVPFIAHYRKEYFQPDLNVDDLWLIFRWDEKWCSFYSSKQSMVDLYQSFKNYQSKMLAENPEWQPMSYRLVTDEDIFRVQSIQSFEELNDFHDHFQLYYHPHIEDLRKFKAEQQSSGFSSENGSTDMVTEDGHEVNGKSGSKLAFSSFKIAKQRDAYSICRDSGIIKLAEKFGLTPEQFGEHLSEGYSRHEIDQNPLDTQDIASEYVCKRFDTPQKVLDAAAFMVGQQLSCDPLVRKTVRQVFYERAKINAAPASKRFLDNFDEDDPLYPIAYLKKKPVTTFTAEQFLELHLAKKKGSMTFEMGLHDGYLNSSKQQTCEYLEEIKNFYYRVSSRLLFWLVVIVCSLFRTS